MLAIVWCPFWLLKSYIWQGEVLKFLFPGFLYFATLQKTTFIDNNIQTFPLIILVFNLSKLYIVCLKQQFFAAIVYVYWLKTCNSLDFWFLYLSLVPYSHSPCTLKGIELIACWSGLCETSGCGGLCVHCLSSPDRRCGTAGNSFFVIICILVLMFNNFLTKFQRWCQPWDSVLRISPGECATWSLTNSQNCRYSSCSWFKWWNTFWKV